MCLCSSIGFKPGKIELEKGKQLSGTNSQWFHGEGRCLAAWRYDRQGGLVPPPFINIIAYSMLSVWNWAVWTCGTAEISWEQIFQFLTHPTSSWSGGCASTVFSSLVDSKSAWTILLGRSPHEVGWVGEVQGKHEWLVDFWCLFEKYPFKSNQRWTQILKSDPHPGLCIICSCFGLLQISAKRNGSTILLAASAK